MLVLTRKAHQTIIIDGGITVTVLGIKGNQVRLGVSAPPDTSINREEVHRRIQEWTEPEYSDCDFHADSMVV